MNSTSPPTPVSNQKPWHKRRWVWVVGAVVIIAAFVNSSGDEEDPALETVASPTPSSISEESEPMLESSPTSTRAPADPTANSDEDEQEAATEELADSLAAEVESALLAANAVDSLRALSAESPGFWIAQFEDISADTLRVYVQTELTDSERDRFAHWVINMSCLNVEELSTVVVRDTTGIDSNHYKNRIQGIIPACTA